MEKFFYWTGSGYEYSPVEGDTLPLAFLVNNIREIELPGIFEKDKRSLGIPMDICFN